MLPFTTASLSADFQVDDFIYLPGMRIALEGGAEAVEGFLIRGGKRRPLALKLPGLGAEERAIILAGSLINYYAKGK
jgi:aconitate hydratase